MVDFGLVTVLTEDSLQPDELARWAEEQGFESMWHGEHSHIPTSRRSPFPLGGELPEWYKHFFDPVVALSAAAAVTDRIKLGSSVMLLPEHHPIHLAKQAACLDVAAQGRLLLGIGAGWNAEEMADHGVAFKDRWKVTRETVLAMREIWTKEAAEYHGEFVDFGPLWCWPKPVQPGGPPIIMGANSKWTPARVAEYCDGWFPLDGPGDLATGMAAIRAEAEKIGRDPASIEMSVIAGYEAAAPARGVARIGELIEMGFTRIAFLLEPGTPDLQWPALEGHCKMMQQFA